MTQHASLLICLLVFSGPAPAAEDERPPQARTNVVFLLTHDLGRRDLGCYGSTFYRTPNIDRLADDTGETKDLSGTERGKVAELHARLKVWRADVGADPMRPNPEYEGARP